jgi:hypothetical protein
VGSDGVILWSTDGGENWTERRKGGVGLWGVALSPDGKSAVAVGREQSISTSASELAQVSLSSSLNAIDSALQSLRVSPYDLLDKAEALELRNELARPLQTARDIEKRRKEIILFQTTGESVKKKEDDSGKNAIGALQDRAFLTTQAIRITAVMFALFLVQFLISLYRYNIRLAGFYDARADALLLADQSSFPWIMSSVEEIDQIMRTLSPEAVDFGKTPRSALDQATRLMQGMGRMGDRVRRS